MISAHRDKKQLLEYMYGLERFGMRPGLTRITKLLQELGNPHRSFPSVHITGTNGKGSTAAFLSTILREAGYRVGLYTSPHIYQFNERISVGGQAISDDELVRLIHEVKAAAETAATPVTFFEFTTALAFLYFARYPVDIAVIEVGMGGTDDATNVIQPVLSIITNIGLDHAAWLGPDRLAIATNKAGIIKTGAPVVTAEEDSQIRDVFTAAARAKGVPLHVVSQELPAETLESSLQQQVFRVTGILNGTFTIPLLGAHQIINARTALLAAAVLNETSWAISPDAMAKGLRHTRWEGRLDIVSTKPLLIVDGAHNDDGVRALLAFLQQLSAPKDVLVLGLKKDKDPAIFAEKLLPQFTHVIVTEGNFQPRSADELRDTFAKTHPSVIAQPHVVAAVDQAKQLAGQEGTVLITGSLYMIADALAHLRP